MYCSRLCALYDNSGCVDDEDDDDELYIALLPTVCVVELRIKRWGTTPRRQKRRDFDAMYYIRVHNRSGRMPRPPVIR